MERFCRLRLGENLRNNRFTKQFEEKGIWKCAKMQNSKYPYFQEPTECLVDWVRFRSMDCDL